jgi:hypothetical protein
MALPPFCDGLPRPAPLECATATSRRSFMGIANHRRRSITTVRTDLGPVRQRLPFTPECELAHIVTGMVVISL